MYVYIFVHIYYVDHEERSIGLTNVYVRIHTYTYAYIDLRHFEEHSIGHTSIHRYIHPYTHTYMHTYIYTHTHTHTFTCTYACTYIDLRDLDERQGRHTIGHTHHTHIPSHITHIHTYAYVCIRMHTYTYVYIRMHMHIQTCETLTNVPSAIRTNASAWKHGLSALLNAAYIYIYIYMYIYIHIHC